jgi:hypothetical protein
MIGKKTLSAIRADLLEQCAKEGIDAAVWFEKQIRNLESGKSPKPAEIETLKLIRDGLRVETGKPKRGGKQVPSR